MKKEFSLLLALGALPTCAFGIDLDYSGEFRLRNQNREFTFSNGDRRNLIEMRARANFKVKFDENLTFNISPQATKNYGELISETNDETDTIRPSSGDKYHSGVDLFEAYIHSTGETISYKLGRQQLNYGDNVILGRRNWTAGGLSFDAAKFTFSIGEGELDLAYAKLSEGGDTSNANDDADLTLAYYKILKEKDLNLDL
jgi:hypothetical protein